MDFRVLGRVRVLREGRDVELGPPKQRLLLAVLLSLAGEVVTTDTLVDAVWGPAPPTSAVDNIYLYVHRLRRALGPHRLAGGRGSNGYSLAVDVDEVDASRASRLAKAGAAALVSGDPWGACRLLGQALAEWHGSPYADLSDEPPLQAEVARLTEWHLNTLEHRIEAGLQLGHLADLVDELLVLVDQHPHRERFGAQLMTVLYRTGRQAEALATYQRIRNTLREQFGLEPGAELRRLQQAILVADPDLEELPRGESTRTIAVARAASPLPAQLPADLADFTGREDALTWLDTTVADVGPEALPILAVTGQAGVGKTALALRWAHRVAARFPDGQLFVNLRGSGPGQPVQPAAALAGFLRALGTAGDAIPPDLDDAAATYRSLLAGRRVLVVLDNAADVSQVRPLLPGWRGCLALITSREHLSGLVARDGLRRLTLDVLDPGTAVRLLERVVGHDRVAREANAARCLAAACGHLPLALRIAAASVLDAPNQSLTEAAVAVPRAIHCTH